MLLAVLNALHSRLRKRYRAHLKPELEDHRRLSKVLERTEASKSVGSR